MKTKVDARLKEEATRFRLQFACPHCAYFNEDSRSCSEGYPVDAHLDPSWERADVLFCKLFELG